MKGDRKSRSKADRMSDGRFAEGNRIWLSRSSHGRKPLFNDPDHLWNACVEYFEWVSDHPLLEEKVFAYQGKITRTEVKKMRAMTIAGLCVFLDISHDTWIEWRKTRSDLSEVIARVEATVWVWKFEGAAADLLNANIISRELGLADKQEHSGPDGEPLKPDTISDLELARRVAFMLARGVEEQNNQSENQEV